jgi:hypothetical protein
MSIEGVLELGGFSALHQARLLDSQLRRVRWEAEHDWTPGEALGEILSYLDRIEHFTASGLTASRVRRRMLWLLFVLQTAVERARAIGLDPDLIGGVYAALYNHDSVLAIERTVTGDSAKAARALIRLEIAYLGPGNQRR